LLGNPNVLPEDKQRIKELLKKPWNPYIRRHSALEKSAILKEHLLRQHAAGELTITGISSDDTTSDCTVYTNWNDLKPMQKVIPTSFGEGEGAGDDYSSLTFTYCKDYHLITEGVNELTSKISCENSPSNISKSYSVNVTGVATGQSQQQQQQQQKPTSEEEGEGETTTATESSEITANDGNTSFTLPLPSENPEIENKQPSESQEENDVMNPKQDEPNIYWDID
jgi:hypothetical protein